MEEVVDWGHQTCGTGKLAVVGRSRASAVHEISFRRRGTAQAGVTSQSSDPTFCLIELISLGPAVSGGSHWVVWVGRVGRLRG